MGAHFPWAPSGLENGNKTDSRLGQAQSGVCTQLVCTRPFLVYTLFLVSTSRYPFPRPESGMENTLLSFSYPVKEVRLSVSVFNSAEQDATV